jgi:short-subunit dehydrogenase involved in D-alanine esterification of teichoic acids
VKLSNTIALITGGTSCVGLAAARFFRDEGAHVIVTGTNQADLSLAARDRASRAVAVT